MLGGLIAGSVAIASTGSVSPVSAQTIDQSLALGDRGAAVRNAQDLLNDFLALSVSDQPLISEDGIFGPNTRDAVESFEDTIGLSINGVLTPSDFAELRDTVEELESVTESSNVELGDDGRLVETWQVQLNDWSRLADVELLPLEADSVYGPNTAAGTRQFEQSAGLQVDGIVEPEDRIALRETLADLRSGAGDQPPLVLGDSGSLVSTAQDLLNSYLALSDSQLGIISEDGYYGPNTQSAVIAFEQAQGRPVDGVLTRGDFDRLRIVVASLEANSADSVVDEGDTGRFVSIWQAEINDWIRLSESAVAPIAVDGIFGSDTTSATVAFERSAVLQADGVVEPEDRVALRDTLRRLRAEAREGTVAGADTLGEIVDADDFVAADADVLRLYYAFFDRQPDVDGAKYWIVDVARSGVPLDEIAQYFATSTEFDLTYGSTTDEEFIETVYANVLDREGDADGVAYWLDQLESRSLKRGGVVRWIAANPEFVDRYPFGIV